MKGCETKASIVSLLQVEVQCNRYRYHRPFEVPMPNVYIYNHSVSTSVATRPLIICSTTGKRACSHHSSP